MERAAKFLELLGVCLESEEDLSALVTAYASKFVNGVLVGKLAVTQVDNETSSLYVTREFIAKTEEPLGRITSGYGLEN
jgi:hypothetical protein